MQLSLEFISVDDVGQSVALNVACILTGNIWVFQMKQCPTNQDMTTATDCFTSNTTYGCNDLFHELYCKNEVYEFVYYDTIARWVIGGLVIVVEVIFASCNRA